MVSKASIFLRNGFVFNLTDVSNFLPFSASETSSTDGRFHIDVTQNWITLLVLV